MATTTVERGAGRAAATQRRNRHAQTTPLPPKGAIEKPTANGADHPRYGTMTLPELRKTAHDLGIPGALRLTKGKALNALLEHERQAAKINAGTAEQPTTKRKRTTPLQKPVKKAASAAVGVSEGGSRSEAKANDFETVAASLGWSTARETSEDDRLTVVAKRGDETIGIEWMGGVFQPPCVYSLGGRTIQLRNASAAKQRMAMKPEAAAQEAERVVERHHNAVERKAAPRRRALKLDLETMTDIEVLEALEGHGITWLNEISGQEESARVPIRREIKRPTNKPRISEGPRGRTITFTSNTGFRTVLLKNIVAVR